MVESRTYIAVPPGETIREQLEERAMSQKEFALRMDMSEKHVSKLINGEVLLTTETAVKLETVLGVPAQFWLKLEAIYRERIVKAEEENALGEEMRLASSFPYAEMAALGWVPPTRSPGEKVKNLRSFFGIVNLNSLENEMISRIACRRLSVTERGDIALMAWVQEAKILSRNMDVKDFDALKLKGYIPRIREMTLEDPSSFCEPLVSLLAECGVPLVFLPHLKGSFLQGASFMDGKRIVIGMTTRGRDSDKFWFSFFHELSHVVLGHVQMKRPLDENDEIVADSWAEKTLIPHSAFASFIRNKDFSENAIKRFSSLVSISPAIVAGRLQKEGLIDYASCNVFKEKYEISL